MHVISCPYELPAVVYMLGEKTQQVMQCLSDNIFMFFSYAHKQRWCLFT